METRADRSRYLESTRTHKAVSAETLGNLGSDVKEVRRANSKRFLTQDLSGRLAEHHCLYRDVWAISDPRTAVLFARSANVRQQSSHS